MGISPRQPPVNQKTLRIQVKANGLWVQRRQLFPAKDPPTLRTSEPKTLQLKYERLIFFQVFQDGSNQYLSRSWLIDPVETEIKAISGSGGSKGEWNGEYYVSFGQSEDRDWQEAVKYGFISGGGGNWYSQTLFLLSPGDRVWVNIPKKGYVGVGRVTNSAVKASEFMVSVDGVQKPFMDMASANYHRQFIDDEEKSEYFVSIDWVFTKKLAESVSEIGFFGNQNTVARPKTHKWIHTVERLRQVFGVND